MASKIPRWTASDIELAVSTYFEWKRNVIVPNISWGLLRGREADLLVARPDSLWCEEVEIKVSRSDIAADLKKNHGHSGEFIRKAWFAVPREISDDERIPKHCGILSVYREAYSPGSVEETYCEVIRRPVVDKSARRLTRAEYEKLLRLSVFRVWTLKKHLMRELNNRRWREAHA